MEIRCIVSFSDSIVNDIFERRRLHEISYLFIHTITIALKCFEHIDQYSLVSFVRSQFYFKINNIKNMLTYDEMLSMFTLIVKLQYYIITFLN